MELVSCVGWGVGAYSLLESVNLNIRFLNVSFVISESISDLVNDQCMIERLSTATGAPLAGNNFPSIPSYEKNKVTRRGPKFTKH